MLDNSKGYKHIIWDWNGTLLDDVNICVQVMNNLLERRNMPLLDQQRYQNIFTFPVKDYYAELGFDFSKEPFERLTAEFISELNPKREKYRLHNGVEDVLRIIDEMGINQSILSAFKEQELCEAVSMQNISGYFTKIAGLNDFYAASKVERGRKLLIELGLQPSEVLLIGDTLHDYEVANELGCDCVLICNGHQSRQIISNCNAHVIDMVSEVIEFLKSEAIA